MSDVAIIDQSGLIKVVDNTIKPIKGDNPAYRARIALALPLGGWLFAPTAGHSLNQFKTVKASPSNVENFQKAARLYLDPYGPQVVSRYLARGVEALTVDVSKETIYG